MKNNEKISNCRQKIYQLGQERKLVESKLMQIGYLNPGAFYWRYTECRKEGCRCQKDKEYRHGPYPYLTYVEDGKIKVRYVGKEELPIVEQGASRYVTFWKGMARIREINKIILKYLEQIKEIRIGEEKNIRKGLKKDEKQKKGQEKKQRGKKD